MSCFPCVPLRSINTQALSVSVLKVQPDINAEESVFLDPNTLSEDGHVAIRGYSFSEDGRYFAYGLSHRGSDWVTIKVLIAHDG